MERNWEKGKENSINPTQILEGRQREILILNTIKDMEDIFKDTPKSSRLLQ